MKYFRKDIFGRSNKCNEKIKDRILDITYAFQKMEQNM